MAIKTAPRLSIGTPSGDVEDVGDVGGGMPKQLGGSNILHRILNMYTDWAGEQYKNLYTRYMIY